MKFTLRPPCAECPFLKKSLPGWLGPDSPESVWAKVHSDDEFGYSCHMDVDKVAKVNEDADTESWRFDPDGTEQCVGALLHAKKTAKSYSDKWREAAREVLSKLIPLEGILGIEFMAHHKDGLKKLKRAK
jgi:hypothetical protein